jgi:lipopolysaccharide biosynthesis glycosyltransferase
VEAGEPINVLSLADRNYAMPLAVMVRSLLENYASDRPLLLKIIDGGLSEQQRERLARSWRGATNRTVHWEFVAPSFGGAQALPAWGRVPALTFARLALGDYYGETASRTVVLDSDTLVLADIAALHDADLQGRAAGACLDPFIPTVSDGVGLADWNELGLSATVEYFNAGVMVADLQLHRKQRVFERAIEYIQRRFYALRQYDQDALNATLAGQWTRLDDRWQVQPRTRNSLGLPTPPDPWIVHFSGRLKPWLYRSDEPLDVQFFEYVDRTQWSGTRPHLGWSALAYRVYDSPLRRICHPLEQRALNCRRAVEAWLAARKHGAR